MKKLSELVEIRTGYTFRSSIESFADGDTEVIQAKDLGELFDLVKRPAVFFPGDDKHLLKAGDVLLSARGFAKARVYRDEGVKSVASSSIFVLSPKSDGVSSEFISMFFNSTPGMKAVFGLSSGASIQAITKDSLGRILIPKLPPDKAENLTKLVQSIDDYRAMLYQKEIHLDNLRSTIIAKTFKETTK